jgi:hypothetical protein
LAKPVMTRLVEVKLVEDSQVEVKQFKDWLIEGRLVQACYSRLV